MFSSIKKTASFALLFSGFVMIPSLVHADDNETELHRIKAKQYIEAKDWTSAEPEAKAVTVAKPSDLDGWLFYGIVEQRLEHNEEAAIAYRKYLDLNPPADKVEAVKQRLAEVEIRSEKVQKETVAVNQERYGSRSDGVFFGFSPVYHPSTSSMLDGGISKNIQFGFQLSHFLIGFLYANGSIPNFEAAPEGSLGTTNPTFTAQGPATLKIYELYLDYNITLTEAYDMTGPFSIFIPVHFGGFSNSLTPSSGSRSFGNIGGDAATGIGFQWFNRTPLTLGATGLFHYGLPFTGVHEDSNSPNIQSLTGSQITGGNATFEFKLTLTYLFGYEKSVAEKANAM